MGLSEYSHLEQLDLAGCRGISASLGLRKASTGVANHSCTSSHGAVGVVIVEVVRLNKIEGQTAEGIADRVGWHVLASHNRASNQSDENDEKGEVEDGVTNHTSASKLGLLHRVDGRSDLATVLRLGQIQNITSKG